MSQDLYFTFKNKVNFDSKKPFKLKFVGTNTDYVKDYTTIDYTEGLYPSAIDKNGIKIVFVPFNLQKFAEISK